MSEARAIIKNIDNTKKLVEELGGLFKGYYSFSDIIFLPKSGKADLNKEFIRLRVYKFNNWPTKKFVLTHKITEWENNSKIDTVVLKQEFNNGGGASEFIKMHFQNKVKKGFVYFREGWEYHLGKRRIFIENIKDFKPTVEIEALNQKDLNDIFKKLKALKRLSDSVPKIMQKICKRLKKNF